MTLRIDVVAADGARTVVLSGRLSRAEVAEFERTVAEAGRPLRIDLGQLIQADAEGRQSLCRQKRSGALLVGASPYVGLLLDSAEEAEREHEK